LAVGEKLICALLAVAFQDHCERVVRRTRGNRSGVDVNQR
jgi:hypothetical protein